jgi:hypothetical protein
MEQIIRRPVPIRTVDASISQQLTVTESDGFWYVDLTIKVGDTTRLIGRFKLTPELADTNQRVKVEYLDFASEADQPFKQGQVVTPFTEQECSAIQPVGHSPFINLDRFMTDAGEVVA